jgi:hypothetical protein
MRLKLFFSFVFFFIDFGATEMNNEMCGKREKSEEREGTDWPWLVVFVDKSMNDFMCGGSLISEKNVLSGE